MKKIEINNLNDLNSNEKYDVLIINTFFEIKDISKPFKNFGQYNYIENIYEKIDNMMNNNSILFVYGITQELIYYYKYFSNNYNFKYLIAADINRNDEDDDLPHRHIDILMLVKGNGLKNLDVKELRIPYIGCESCGKNVKDWGGKKHLMNKLGTAISDVWKDFHKTKYEDYDIDVSDIKLKFINRDELIIDLKDHIIPNIILDRLVKMTNTKSKTYLLVELNRNFIDNNLAIESFNDTTYNVDIDESIENKVIHSDSIVFLKSVIKKYPNGYFDLVFADPPYNLVKDYSEHNDGMTEIEYINWCNEWLRLCSKSLKPNGTLIVLNIPKWSLQHSLELNEYLYLKNWIVWDALSVPLGKIMPAHYGLLYYVKNENNYTFNTVFSSYKQNQCLRSKCVNRGSLFTSNSKINDIWSDVHRIKHKKDRDSHPCQLPIGLLDRIITMTTNKGDIVYDPFGGTGTTAITAKQLGRRYCISELSKEYVDISNNLLSNVDKNGELIRTSKEVSKNIIPKKQIEKDIQILAIELNRKPTIDEFIRKYDIYTESIINEIYGSYNRLLKVVKVVLG